MAIIFFRTILLYLMIVFSVRLMGKPADRRVTAIGIGDYDYCVQYRLYAY